jgi:lipid-binding SYLF domain-containing protein
MPAKTASSKNSKTSQQKKTTTIEERAAATLKRLEEKDPGLKQLLKKAYGYAVFPSVGKASLVVGGSYGHGAVYERGKFIGHATISQFTVGVQIGGDTFTEVLVFENKQALERLRHGKMAFAADASAVLVKAGAGAARGFSNGVAAYAYASGGMLIEAAIGGQKFAFKPAGEEDEPQQQGKSAGGKGKAAASGGQDEGDAEGDEGQDDESSGLLGRAMGGVRSALGGAADGVKSAASRVTETAKAHPIATTFVATAAATGAAVLIVRAIRGSGASSEGQGSDEQAGYDDEGAEQDQENQPQGQAEEGGEEEEQDEGDQGAEGEESDQGDTLNQLRDRRRRSRA